MSFTSTHLVSTSDIKLLTFEAATFNKIDPCQFKELLFPLEKIFVRREEKSKDVFHFLKDFHKLLLSAGNLLKKMEANIDTKSKFNSLSRKNLLAKDGEGELCQFEFPAKNIFQMKQLQKQNTENTQLNTAINVNNVQCTKRCKFIGYRKLPQLLVYKTDPCCTQLVEREQNTLAKEASGE